MRTARSARPWRSGMMVYLGSVSTVPTAICEPASMYQRPRHPVWRSTGTTAGRRGECPDMRSVERYFSPGRVIGAVLLLAVIACGASGCYEGYGYGGGDP